MTKAEVAAGLAAGRTLIQEEWADPLEIALVDELVREGVAVATPWEWRENFQCERRRITDAGRAALAEHDGREG